MNVKALILLIIMLSMSVIGCIESTNSHQQSDLVTIKLVKAETINDVNFKVFHDDEYNVTCWLMDTRYNYGEAGNCIPDYELNKK